VTFTVAHRCYRMVTVATGDKVMLLRTVATEDHNSDGRFDDIMEEPL
jgi:hypothetical protein